MSYKNVRSSLALCEVFVWTGKGESGPGVGTLLTVGLGLDSLLIGGSTAKASESASGQRQVPSDVIPRA